MTPELTPDERKTLSVLAFLFFRMGLDERARRVYSALAELSPEGSTDYRFAQAGTAAVDIELGNGAAALAALRRARANAPLTSQEAALYLLEAQALWLEGRKEEAQEARDRYLRLMPQRRNAARG